MATPVPDTKYRHRQYGTIAKVIDSDGTYVRLLIGENPRQRVLRLYIELLDEHYELLPTDDSLSSS